MTTNEGLETIVGDFTVVAVGLNYGTKETSMIKTTNVAYVNYQHVTVVVVVVIIRVCLSTVSI